MTQPQDLARNLIAELRTALDQRLRAATLFGSAARDEWIEGVSDVNVLVLVDHIDAQLIERAAPASRKAAASGVAPLLMELDEWQRAADVFAIEIADMQDASIVLLGEDPTSLLTVNAAALRLQAERELRGKLLHLHGAMLLAADDAKRLGRIFVHALPSFVSYMRAALRLEELPVPSASRDVIEASAKLTGADPAAFQRVLDARVAGRDLELPLNDALADDFNTAAAALSSYIDNFGRHH